MQNHYRTARGYTIVELSITVLVVGVLAGYAIPGFQNLLASVRYNRSAENIVDSLELARNQAIFTGRAAMICTSANLEAAQPTCRADQSAWGEVDPADSDRNEGWIVFEDCNGDNFRDTAIVCDNDDNPLTFESNERISKIYKAIDIDPGVNVEMTSDVSGPIRFTPQGTVQPNIEFTVLAHDGEGKINLSAPARIQVSFEEASL